MTKLHVGVLRAQVEDPPPMLARELHTALRARPKGFFMSTLYKRRLWDGYENYYDLKTGRFPAGLVPYVLRRFPGRFTLVDTRQALPMPGPVGLTDTKTGGPFPLRPFQHEALDAVTGCQVAGLAWPRGILRIGTAGGKSAVLAALAQAYQVPTLLVVQRRGLLHQLHDDLAGFLGERIGRVGDGMAEDRHRITVATAQTLVDLDGFPLESVQALYVDEAHHAASDTCRTIAGRLPRAVIRIGVSATPHDRENRCRTLKTMGMLGDVLYTKDAAALAAEGWVAPVTVRYQVIKTPTIVTDPAGERYASWKLKWAPQDGSPSAYDALIVENPARNAAIARFLAEAPPGQVTLVLVNRLDHGERLAGLTGVPFLDGSDPSRIRQPMLGQLRRKERVACIASPILDEGANIPSVRRLCLAGGGKSEILYLQRIGRGMRKESASDALEVRDFLDVTNETLQAHSRARAEAAIRAGYTVVVDREEAAA